jgi:glycosyltransferase involved in cell wall biosynthesis
VIGNANVGGMEVAVRSLAGHLMADGCVVTCICPYESPYTASLRALGCDVFITPIGDDPSWRSIQLTLEVARLYGCDLIHAHMPKAHVLAGLAGSLAHLPAIATVHGMNITSHELGICRATGSHLITVCQEAFVQALAMGVPAERLTLITNGVDLKRFRPVPRTPAFRAALDIPPDAPLVGFVGRLDHEKGPDLFMRAMAHAFHRHHDLHAVMVGDGMLAGHLSDLATQLGLGPRLHMAGQREVDAEVYRSLDLLAQTSRSEGMPLVLLEAMACGVPAVAIAVGGVAEVIEHEATGQIVGAGDWEGVGIKVARLLEQPERLCAMGEAARRRAEERFDLDEGARRTAALFRQLGRAEAALALGDAQIS